MKAHKYWSLGALAAMIGTFYTGYKNMKTAHKYFACSSLLWLPKRSFQVCDVASSAYLPHSGKSRLGCEAGAVMKFVFIPFVYCWRAGT